MRILLIMDPFIPVPPLHYGGIERVVFDIANYYVKIGHKVTLVAGPNSTSPGKLIIYGQNGMLDKKLNITTLFHLYRIIYKEAKNHDVIHNFGRLAFLAPFLKSKIKKVQTYMRYVNLKNINLYDRFKPKNLIYTAVSDAIVSTGKTPQSNWKTVYNCAPINNYDFQPNTPCTNYLSFLGRIERCKGLHTAIKVAQLTNMELVIAGNISELPEELAYFNEEIKPLIDGKQIKYIGVVNDIQKNTFLGNSSALLSPIEWFEPFPIIIPEAFACGTPVLGFKNGGLPEGINQGVTGFISTTAQEMAAHVLQIATLNRNECRAAAENRFSDKVIGDEYIKIYSS